MRISNPCSKHTSLFFLLCSDKTIRYNPMHSCSEKKSRENGSVCSRTFHIADELEQQGKKRSIHVCPSYKETFSRGPAERTRHFGRALEMISLFYIFLLRRMCETNKNQQAFCGDATLCCKNDEKLLRKRRDLRVCFD